jgi:HEPN domain-containing protein
MDKMDLVAEWLDKAQQDQAAAKHLCNDIYPKLTEIACYHCQQAAEKALKAYLIYKDIEHPYTHDLDKLCILCEDTDESFMEIAEKCSDISQYAVITRYPNEVDINEEDASDAIEKSRFILQFVVNLISPQAE